MCCKISGGNWQDLTRRPFHLHTTSIPTPALHHSKAKQTKKHNMVVDGSGCQVPPYRRWNAAHAVISDLRPRIALCEGKGIPFTPPLCSTHTHTYRQPARQSRKQISSQAGRRIKCSEAGGSTKRRRPLPPSLAPPPTPQYSWAHRPLFSSQDKSGKPRENKQPTNINPSANHQHPARSKLHINSKPAINQQPTDGVPATQLWQPKSKSTKAPQASGQREATQQRAGWMGGVEGCWWL